MTIASEIPLSPAPQRMSITLSNVTYQLNFVWNETSQCWIMSISDSSGTPLIQGAAITTGADIIEQFEYLGLGGKLIAQTDSNVDAVPTFTNLGLSGHLYWVTP